MLAILSELSVEKEDIHKREKRERKRERKREEDRDGILALMD